MCLPAFSRLRPRGAAQDSKLLVAWTPGYLAKLDLLKGYQRVARVFVPLPVDWPGPVPKVGERLLYPSYRRWTGRGLLDAGDRSPRLSRAARGSILPGESSS